ncbi:hypothetical protein [Derxia gummosa]|uniref:Capsular polysaccharide transport system permease protein n=1 Tax=Derxia gummosa DSM 723 TaxID=1121388 RepID=A0A8B6XBN7_9BURK|nr:hypothetical protein [Derxia gummosa]
MTHDVLPDTPPAPLATADARTPEERRAALRALRVRRAAAKARGAKATALRLAAEARRAEADAARAERDAAALSPGDDAAPPAVPRPARAPRRPPLDDRRRDSDDDSLAPDATGDDQLDDEPTVLPRLRAARRQRGWRDYPAFVIAFVASVLAIAYWGFVASPRYVSEAHVVIQQADMPGGGGAVDFSSLLGGIGGSGDRPNQLLLRDHLMSVDMLDKLEQRLHLRAHYADKSRDFVSRMFREDAPIEWFHDYFQSRVTVEYDEYTGLLLIRTQAYTPEMATAITTELVDEGERYMNLVGHRLAEVQVRFLESQVGDMRDRALTARQKLLAFQNEHGMAAPETTAENIVGIVNKLDGQLSDLATRRNALLGYLVPTSPAVVDLDLQIAATRKQLEQEKARLAAPEGKPLNQTVEEYQRLEMSAQFDQDVYKTALSALEQGRIQAARTLKKVSVLQAPTVPQYSMEPRRLYNIAAFTLAAFLLAAVVQLLIAVISEHRD